MITIRKIQKRLEYIYAMLETLDQQGLESVSPRMATHDEIALVHEASTSTS